MNEMGELGELGEVAKMGEVAKAGEMSEMSDCDKRVLLLLGSAFEDAEAACALDFCGWSAYRPTLPNVSVTIASLHERVEGRFGLAFDHCVSVCDICPDDFDGLVIPGGFRPAFDEVYCDEVYDLIRAFAKANKPIATMCVGVIPVARAGVLKGGFATTYEFSRHSNFDMIAEQGCLGRHEAVCDCDGIISCSGPWYSDEVMTVFLEHLLGEGPATELVKYRKGLSQ